MLEKIQVSNFAALGQDIDQCKVDALKEQAVNAVEKLEKGTGEGNDFLGCCKSAKPLCDKCFFTS